MSNINQIILFELNKLGKMIQAGNVSGSNISKVRSLGMLKDPEHYNRGLKKGTSEIIRKHGLEYTLRSKTDNQGPSTRLLTPSSSPEIQMSRHSKLRDKVSGHERELVKRHEAIEGRELKKINDKFSFDHAKSSNFGNSHINTKPVESDKYHSDFMHNAFGLFSKVRELRNSTGEFDKLKDKKLVKDTNNPKSKLNMERFKKFIPKAAPIFHKRNIDSFEKDMRERKEKSNNMLKSRIKPLQHSSIFTKNRKGN